ncbi:hypothetical protein [Pseudomonas aeruginosa]|uniref:hypothetical protein n=1 Tax=Pseudomonas aeruginosa TaxID=287 RepID=UPI0015F03E20|nr:hypothetical protein [Pseudomonas aeruginosa]
MDGAAYSNARDGLQWAFDIRAMAGQPLATDQLASYRTAVDDYLGMLAEHRQPWFPASTNATCRCTRRCASAWPEVAYSLTSM